MASRVPILMYHKIDQCPQGALVPHHYVSPTRFESHLNFLRKLKFQSIKLESLEPNDSWPARGISLTFDDGYQNFIQFAVPLMQKHGFVGTVFVVTRLLGQDNAWDVSLGDVSEPLMGSEEIKRVHSLGFEVGSHSQNHARLADVTLEVARTEIEGSFRDLTEILQCEPKIFCYPYGSHNNNVVEIVQNSGYRAACSVKKGWNNPTTNRFLWRRINVRKDTSSAILMWKLWKQSRIKAIV